MLVDEVPAGGTDRGDVPVLGVWWHRSIMAGVTHDDEGARMALADPSLPKSAQLNARLHAAVPGGAHTYAKGEDQYPENLAPVISHGRGAWMGGRPGGPVFRQYV